MVFGALSRSGGWARRYFRVRKDVYAVQWKTPDRYPCIPIHLFDFGLHDDYVDGCRVAGRDRDGWRLSDDGVIGGFSKSKGKMILNHPDEAETEQTPLDSDESILEWDEFAKEQQTALEDEETDFLPFLRWHGSLNTKLGLQSDARRSGFCSLRSPEFPLDGANLRGLYQAVEILCRTDGRSYTVNLKVSTAVPDDVYQDTINIDASDDFQQVVLPFDRFSLTSRGREREFGRQLDDRVAIESIGFTLMDGQDGDFCFDLARVRAVNMYGNAVMEESPDLYK